MSSRYFSFTRINVKGNTCVTSTGFPRVAIVLEGSGKFIFEESFLKLCKGDEVFLPSDIPGFSIEGDISMVFCNPQGVVI